MSISVSKSGTASPRALAAAVGRLGRALQPAQVVTPERLEELAHRLEALGAHHEQVAGAVTLLVDEPRVLQHAEVLRDGLGGDVEVRGDLADRARLVAHEFQDRPPVRLGQRAQNRVGAHGVRPRYPTSRSITGAPLSTATTGPMSPPSRVSDPTACSAKPRKCVARSASNDACCPVARARSQPCTMRSRPTKPPSPAPCISPIGVLCIRSSVSS